MRSDVGDSSAIFLCAIFFSAILSPMPSILPVIALCIFKTPAVGIILAFLTGASYYCFTIDLISVFYFIIRAALAAAIFLSRTLASAAIIESIENWLMDGSLLDS